MNIRAIIFDFGNVLVRWNPHAVFAPFFGGNTSAVDAFMSEINFHDWNLAQDAGRPFRKGVALLSAQFPHYAHIIRAYDEQWEASISGAIEGSVTIAHQLRQSGFPLYGLTNFSAEKFPLMRQRFAFLDWFEDIVVSGETGMVKPQPEIYYYTLRRIGYPPEACLFVDDSLANIQTARQIGLCTIQFQSPQQLEADLKQKGIL